MKWFIVVMTISNSSVPVFDATEMPSQEMCQKSVDGAKMQMSSSGNYGNAVLIYCALGTPQISSWTYAGKMRFVTPKPMEE